MIITCPGCGRQFELQRKPPKTFKCPRCSFSTPFNIVLGMSQSTGTGAVSSQGAIGMPGAGISAPPTNPGEVPAESAGDKTRVVDGLGISGAVTAANEEKTKMVAALQKQSKRGVFQITFAGVSYGVLPIPVGKTFNVGRRSSDGNALLKLTPDISMSRVHAMMRTGVNDSGDVNFQIATLKDENPVYVNGKVLPKGKGVTLHNGDRIKMGDTDIVFRLI